MTDMTGLAVIVRIRAARLAALERDLTEVAAKAAEASRQVQLAENAVKQLMLVETARIDTERRALLNAPFQIEALTAYKRGREQAQDNIASANQLAASLRTQFSGIETIRRQMARKVLMERARKDCLDRNLKIQERAHANRREARTMEEFGEGKTPES